jgi:hypothetical protein
MVTATPYPKAAFEQAPRAVKERSDWERLKSGALGLASLSTLVFR